MHYNFLFMTSKDDAKLLIGDPLHGFQNWEKIRLDEFLKMPGFKNVPHALARGQLTSASCTRRHALHRLLQHPVRGLLFKYI